MPSGALLVITSRTGMGRSLQQGFSMLYVRFWKMSRSYSARKEALSSLR